MTDRCCRAVCMLSAVWYLVTTWTICPWDIPGKKTGVGCHFLLQGIFLTQGLNPRFLNSSAGKESARNARDPGLIPELERSPGEGIGYPLQYSRASLAAQLVKNLPAMGEFSSAQSLSRVWLFVTPRIAAHQASLSITNCRSLPKPMSIELVMPSNDLMLCHPFLLLPQSLQHQGLLKWVNYSHEVAKVQEFQL